MPEPLPEIQPPLPVPPLSGLGRGLRLLGKGVLVAAAFYFAWRLIAGMRWADLAARLGDASWPLVAAAVFFLVLRFALWDLRFRLAAGRATGTPPPGARFGFAVLLASAALHLLNPAARVLAGPL